ncbi:hypothetical protein AVEN_117523-1 [Araneus ventricosus]|uniref:Uncharacterized protein n=1 Tax=Araneus ventricosus TaxID=182803 RepID=A0A4Y2ERT9_ARAVE|nr:hypothetical protein AVEN_117523-1 [Araneus ventricosus]
MRVTWGDIGAVRRILQDLPSKFFKELEGLLGHMWPSVALENHYPIRELAPALALDGLFVPMQPVALEHRARHSSQYTSFICDKFVNHSPLCANHYVLFLVYQISR